MSDLTADGTPAIIHGLIVRVREKARLVGAAPVLLLAVRGHAAETVRFECLLIGGLI